MSSASLFTLGNLTIDDIVSWPTGETWMGQPGGNVLFSALGARIWLEDVGILARVGVDYPQTSLEAIRSRGFHAFLHPVDSRALHDWALYEAEGGRQFINHLNSGSNDSATIRPEEIMADARNADAYHVAPMPTELQAALVTDLHRPDVLISLDPHESWIEGREKEIHEMLAEVDFFLPSELEATKLFGGPDAEAAASEFSRFGPAVVVIKLGAEGSLLYDSTSNQMAYIPAYPADVLDTTGAGDAYCGGFMAGYLFTRNPIQAALYGTVSASFVVEAIGALSTIQPDLEAARSRLEHLQTRTGLELGA